MCQWSYTFPSCEVGSYDTSDSFSDCERMPATILEMGKFCPITPVDMTKVSCSNLEKWLGKRASVSLTIAHASSSPCFPAFAHPLFTTILEFMELDPLSLCMSSCFGPFLVMLIRNRLFFFFQFEGLQLERSRKPSQRKFDSSINLYISPPSVSSPASYSKT